MFQNVIITRPARGVFSTRTGLPGPEYRLTAWHQQFVQRIRSLNTTKELLMQRFADDTLMPIFEEIRGLTEDLGLFASSSMSRSGTITFQFRLKKRATLLMTVHPCKRGCDVLSQVSIPGFRTISPTYDSVDSLENQHDWARKIFEDALDTLVDALAEAAEAQAFDADLYDDSCHVGVA